MNKRQIEKGIEYLSEWLANEEAFGKTPAKIEYTFDFEENGLRFYTYRFRKTARSKWLIGICGFEGDDLRDIGLKFSGMDGYDETAPELARKMARFIIMYLQRQAAQETFSKNLEFITKGEITPELINGQFVKSQTRFFLYVGTVDIPSGKVIAADPLAYLSGEHIIAPVLKREIPAGSYRAEVSICRDVNGIFGVRMCTARLKIKETPAVRYELAESEDESAAARFKDGVMHGFPVDAGMMCFIDARGAGAFDKFLDKWHKENPGKNRYDDYFAGFLAESEKKYPQYQRGGGDFTEWTNPDTDERMVMIASGFGDGFYRSFWGIDADGEICELIVPLVNANLIDRG